jgi:polyhydroxyalkanoate synthase
MATPIDFHQLGPLTAMVRENRLQPEMMIDETGNVPGEVMRNGLRLLRPTDDVVQYTNLWQHLWNDKFMESYQAIGGWVRDDVPFPGATFRQTVDLFARDNALLAGEVPIGERTVRLRDITCPFLNVVAEQDHIVPIASAEPATALVGSQDKDELRLDAGHVALLLGRHASKVTVPAIAEWLERHGSSAGRRRQAGTPAAAKPTTGESP